MPNRNYNYGSSTNSGSGSNNNSGNNGSSSKVVKLGQYMINREKAIATLTATKAYDFLNPAEDFIGIVECKGNIRHIEKRGDMKQDIEVIDCKVIVGYQSREIEEETNEGLLIRRREEKYEDKDYSIVLTKAVLLSKFKKLQDELKDLTGKRIVIIGLGKAEDKNYYDYYVATEEQARKDNVLQIMNRV